MKKKLITTLLVLSMVLTLIPCFTIAASADAEDTIPDIIAPNDNPVWDGTVTDADKTWYTDNPEAMEFHISTPAEYASIQSLCAEAGYFLGKKIYIDKDLYFNNVTNIVSDSIFSLQGRDGGTPNDWRPYAITSFKGIIDGTNHTIFGFYLNKPGENYTGMFMKGTNECTIQNLSIHYCNVLGTSVLFSYAATTINVINVDIRGKVEGRAATDFGVFIGGTSNWCGTLDNCSFSGLINKENESLDKSGVLQTKSIGGLVGQITGGCNVTIKNCSVNAKVQSKDSSGNLMENNVGGLVGGVTIGNNYVLNIENSTVIAVVESSNYAGLIIGNLNLVNSKTNRPTTNIKNVFALGETVGENSGSLFGKVEVRGTNPMLNLTDSYYCNEKEIAGSLELTEKCVVTPVQIDSNSINQALLAQLNSWVSTNQAFVNGKTQYKYWTLDENNTPVFIDGSISGAQLSLKDSLNIRFATKLQNINEANLRVTSPAGSTLIPFANASQEGELLVFDYIEIAPQYINANILVELLSGENVIAKLEDYSVATYCNNMKAKTKEDLGYTEAKKAALDNLLEDVLRYGATAQIYTNTEAGNLPSYTSPTTYDEANLPALSPQTTNPAKGSGETRLTAAGIEYNNYNKLYFKVDIVAKDGSTYRVRVEDTHSEEYIFESYTVTETIVLYSPALALSELADAEYRVVIEEITSEGTTVVTDYVYGTVNYVKNMAGKGDANANLTQAVYQCSKSAAAFKAAQ